MSGSHVIKHDIFMRMTDWVASVIEIFETSWWIVDVILTQVVDHDVSREALGTLARRRVVVRVTTKDKHKRVWQHGTVQVARVHGCPAARQHGPDTTTSYWTLTNRVAAKPCIIVSNSRHNK